MNKLIAYGQKLVEEAETLYRALAQTPITEEERRNRPILLDCPPDTWSPGDYSSDFCIKFKAAVDDLYKIAKTVKEEGYERVRIEGFTQIHTGEWAPQELQEAIESVKKLLESV